MKYTDLLFFLVAFLSLHLVSSRYGKNDDIFPIGNFQASLTASEGQGTIAAIQSSGSDIDYVVIVSRSPAAESNCNLTRSFLTSQMSDETKEYESEKEDLGDDDDEMPFENLMTPIRARGAITKSTNNEWKRESRTLHVLQEQVGICLAMTGFVSDVRHLVRYVANAVSEHEYIYGGEAPSVHSLVRGTMASYIRDATTFGGSRPFGVQGLMVGNERENYINSSGNTLQIYTLDPSGNFRHCVGGVATIGKNANIVRDSMCNALKDVTMRKDSLDYDIQHHVDIALKSILENVIETDDISPSDMEKAKQFEAIVVFGNRKSSYKSYSCAILKTESILRSYKRCIKAIIQKHETKI